MLIVGRRHGGRAAERRRRAGRVPVIAVPTSVGYGASFGGLAALLAMLNSLRAGRHRRQHRQRLRRRLRGDAHQPPLRAARAAPPRRLLGHRRQHVSRRAPRRGALPARPRGGPRRAPSAPRPARGARATGPAGGALRERRGAARGSRGRAARCRRRRAHAAAHPHPHDHDHDHGPLAGPRRGAGARRGPRPPLRRHPPPPRPRPPRARGARPRAGIFSALGEAEAPVHGMRLEHVHFHEVGAVDAIVDVVGAAIALERLGVRAVSRRRPCAATGRWAAISPTGDCPLPAPRRRAPERRADCRPAAIARETLTPTGAAILRRSRRSSGRSPR